MISSNLGKQCAFTPHPLHAAGNVWHRKSHRCVWLCVIRKGPGPAPEPVLEECRHHCRGRLHYSNLDYEAHRTQKGGVAQISAVLGPCVGCCHTSGMPTARTPICWVPTMCQESATLAFSALFTNQYLNSISLIVPVVKRGNWVLGRLRNSTKVKEMAEPGLA